MAWSISISSEGWSEIHEALEALTAEALVNAISDDKFEAVYKKADLNHATRAADAERKRLESVPHDSIVDLAYDLIFQNDTCDNGGFAYWIDREGHHKVHLS